MPTPKRTEVFLSEKEAHTLPMTEPEFEKVPEAEEPGYVEAEQSEDELLPENPLPPEQSGSLSARTPLTLTDPTNLQGEKNDQKPNWLR